MTGHSWTCGNRDRQHGVSVITAIFLLLLFAALAALMANMISTAHTTSAQDIEGARAYQAARAGVEWGVYQLDPNATAAALPVCFAKTTLHQIPNFTVDVQCDPFPAAGGTYQEGARTIRIYRITATARAPGARPPGIEREIVVTMEKCRDPAITVAPFDC